MMARAVEVLRQLNYISLIRNYFMLTIGVTLTTLSFHLFMAPTSIAPGGIPGLALILTHFTDLSYGVSTFLVRLPMMALGFFFLGGFRFLLSTWYIAVAASIGIDALAYYFPTQGITDDLLLNTIYAGVFGGIGLGFIYMGGSTPAGTSVISRIIQNRTGLPTSQLFLMVDGGIITVQGLLFGWETSLYAIVMMLIWGIATDYAVEGPSVVRTTFIITTHPDDISEALHDMGIGVTGWGAEGMYSHTAKTTLFCTVRRPDMNAVRAKVSAVDPEAFIVIGQGHQASGGVLAKPQPTRRKAASAT